MSRRPYPTDLTDTEWTILEPLIPAAKPGGRPPRHSHRELVDAMSYVLRTGCAWRQLPHDLPPWQTVYHYVRLWRHAGLFAEIHDLLRPISVGPSSMRCSIVLALVIVQCQSELVPRIPRHA
jgi:putative transposase